MAGAGCHPNTMLSASCASLGSATSQLCDLSLFLGYFSFLQSFHHIKNKLLDKMHKQTFPHDEVLVLELCPRSNKVLPK